MALKLKPQTVYVQPAAENVEPTTKVVRVPGFGDAVAVRCQVTPNAKGAIYTRYGLDLTNPHTLFCDVSDATLFPLGSRVSYGGRTFAVAAPAELMLVGMPADHAKLLLEELAVTP
jgi:hypothetical protein